jgi:hypothetical protein
VGVIFNFKQLLATTRKAETPAKDVELALASAVSAVEKAKSGIAAAKDTYARSLLEDDFSAAVKAQEGLARAEIEYDRAMALASVLERQRTQREQVENAAAREETIKKGKAAIVEAERLVKTVYPKAAIAIQTMLARLYELQADVDAANSVLPPENRISLESWRHPPEPARTRVIEQTEYFSILTGEIVSGPLAMNENIGSRKTRREISIVPEIVRAPKPLVDAINLPGILPADEDFWRTK